MTESTSKVIRISDQTANKLKRLKRPNERVSWNKLINRAVKKGWRK